MATSSRTDPIAFIDMAEREEEERRRLRQRSFELEERKRENGGVLEPELETELQEVKNKLGQDDVVDPLFRAVAKDMDDSSRPVADHVHGLLPSQTASPVKPPTANENALAAAYGILELDNRTNPGVRFTDTKTEVVLAADLRRRFATDLARAHGEYNGDRELFDAVLPVLAELGDKRIVVQLPAAAGTTTTTGTSTGPRNVTADAVRATDWASVVRNLRDRGVTAFDIHLRLAVERAISGQGGIADGAPPSTIDIDLPDLESFADVEIIGDNLKAMQALYFSAMLEDLRMFQVTDKLVELFQLGQLPLGKGKAGDLLYGYWKKSVNRMSEVERRNLYGRAFGFPGGEPTFGNPNREFSDLWLRFVSAVSSVRRQLTVDELLRATIPVTVSEEQVRKSGRDLAANLSLHGYGVAYFAAAELQDQVREIIALLSDPEIKNAYGSRDMFQVIDQVATLELGGASNSVRYRTMADAGAIIIRWLANHADLLASSAGGSLLALDDIRRTPVRPAGSRPGVTPTDRDLVEACDRWLAVTGTNDTRIEEYAQPVEAPMMTSRPVQIPSVARDLLESVGVGLPATARSNGIPAR